MIASLEGRRIVTVHPSPDLYGSDRVFADAVRAFGGRGRTSMSSCRAPAVSRTFWHAKMYARTASISQCCGRACFLPAGWRICCPRRLPL